MNLSVSVLICFLVLELTIAAKRISYEGYKLHEVYPYNEEQAKLLETLENDADVSFLSHSLSGGLGHPVNILVSPQAAAEFSKSLATNKIQSTIVIDNFERYLKYERTRSKRAAQLLQLGEINFDGYHRHDVINDYLKRLANEYPDVVSLINVGKTTENRDLLALKISSGSFSKPTILVDARFHAREWIAPAVALYIIQQLVESSANNNLIANVDWIVIPVMNPDGYEYTHTIDRMWRKTRSPGLNCTGTDMNRNFLFHWGEKGSNQTECSETYHGPTPFSEPETRAFRDLVLKYAPQIKLSLSLHSYGQFILYPWGYTRDLPLNVEELDALGNAAGKAIENVDGTKYKVNSTARGLYYAAGTSSDWVKAVAGINLAYVVELPPIQGDPILFKLSSKYIKSVVFETFQGIKVFHGYVETKEMIT